jgi:hypothetical protein
MSGGRGPVGGGGGGGGSMSGGPPPQRPGEEGPGATTDEEMPCYNDLVESCGLFSPAFDTLTTEEASGSVSRCMWNRYNEHSLGEECEAFARAIGVNELVQCNQIATTLCGDDPEPFECLYAHLPDIQEETCNALVQNFIMMKIIADGDGDMDEDDDCRARQRMQAQQAQQYGFESMEDPIECDDDDDDILFWLAVATAGLLGLCCCCCFCYGTYQFICWMWGGSRTSRGSRVRYGKLAQQDDGDFDEEWSEEDEEEEEDYAPRRSARKSRYSKRRARPSQPNVDVVVVDGEVELT